MKFKGVFDKTSNSDLLKPLLEDNHLWFKVGEQVLKDEPASLKELKIIKHKKHFDQNLTFLTSLETKMRDLSWEDFKSEGVKYGFKLLEHVTPSKDKMGELTLIDKEEIALALLPSEEVNENGWQYFVTETYEGVFLPHQKIAIKNSHQQRVPVMPTVDLIKLINQAETTYTMNAFFNACKLCKPAAQNLMILKNICEKEIAKANKN